MQIEYLIEWKDFATSESTWEREQNLDCAEILIEFESNRLEAVIGM